VTESPVSFECKLNRIIDFGTEPPNGSLVIGRWSAFTLEEDVLKARQRPKTHGVMLAKLSDGIPQPDDERGIGRIQRSNRSGIIDVHVNQEPTSSGQQMLTATKRLHF
jgi:hypothetical protein